MVEGKNSYESGLLAEILFPGVMATPADYELRYPERMLPSGARVTRFAPSPTGFMHIGGLFAALISQRIASQSGGIFYLRIEDTDKKREIEDGVSEIINSLASFDVYFDEGQGINGLTGAYGPYKQSERAEIYQTFAKELVRKGLAYPCFCSEAELQELRVQQETAGVNTGYYGKWAMHRNIDIDLVERELAAGRSFVLRLRAPENSGRVEVEDLIRGKLEMPENNVDAVLLKSDGIPTYHFAHAVDDHLMRTTDVIRGEEWLASLPLHVQMFEYLGWQAPRYAHISPIMKQDGGSKRKLSKRKDPEAAVAYYHEQGYPADAVKDYLLTLANSDFEDWRRENPQLSNSAFELRMEKLSISGALFDIAKLNDISKEVISRLSAESVSAAAGVWAALYDEKLSQLLAADRDYAVSIFSIDRYNAKPRKDIAKWADVHDFVSYFYDELFVAAYDFEGIKGAEKAAAVLKDYINTYNPADDNSSWFDRIKELAGRHGFAPETKLYKKNPGNYCGSVGDVSMLLRIAVTGRRNTPELHQVLAVMGKERVLRRLNICIASLGQD